jgi:hypothetical protein
VNNVYIQKLRLNEYSDKSSGSVRQEVFDLRVTGFSKNLSHAARLINSKLVHSVHEIGKCYPKTRFLVCTSLQLQCLAHMLYVLEVAVSKVGPD